MYKWLIRPILFSFDPEKVHYFTTGLLRILLKTPVISSLYKNQYKYESDKLQTKVFDTLI